MASGGRAAAGCSANLQHQAVGGVATDRVPLVLLLGVLVLDCLLKEERAKLKS